MAGGGEERKQTQPRKVRRAVIVEQSEGLQLPAVQVSELKLIDHAGNHVATAKRVLKVRFDVRHVFVRK